MENISPRHKVFRNIYDKLQKVIPDLETNVAQGKSYGKSQVSGYMDLSFDHLSTDDEGNIRIAIAHNYIENGDVVPHPDMEVLVMPKEKFAEALTYQNRFVFQRVYDEYEGEPFTNLKLRSELNQFLDQWLSNLIEQGHSVNFSAADRELAVKEIEKKIITPEGKYEARSR